MSNTQSSPKPTNLEKCWTVDLRDQYEFLPGGGFIVDLRTQKSQEVEQVLTQSPAGESLKLISQMVHEIESPEDRAQFNQGFSVVIQHIREIPLDILEENILWFVDKWFLEESLIFLEYLLSQRLTPFSRLIEQIIVLYSEWEKRHKGDAFIEVKKNFTTKLDILIRIWESSKLITIWEKKRIRWLYYEYIIKDIDAAGEEYCAWIEETDGWCCFQYGSIFARDGDTKKANVYYTIGWTECANTDCLLGLYGIAIQDDNHLKVAQFWQIIRHFWLHQNLNSDPLRFLCNSNTSLETLYAVFESYPQFTREWLKNLRTILEKKKLQLSHDIELLDEESSNWRSITYQRLDIMVFEMIAFWDLETIKEVTETLSLWHFKDPQNYLQFLFRWLESTPSGSLQKQSLDLPVWSDSIDNLSSESGQLQNTLSRERNLWTVETFWKSAIMTYLRIIRAASLTLVEGDHSVEILRVFLDSLWVLRRIGYWHLEEIDFLEEELKRQRDSIVQAEHIRSDWSDELFDSYKKYKKYVDDNWNTRTRANMVIEVLTGKKDIKSIKDPFFSIYILSEILCFSPENMNLLNDIIDYIYTLDLKPWDCIFIWWILSRMPFYEEASLDFLVDADVVDIWVLESLSIAYRAFKESKDDINEESIFDTIENEFEDKFLATTRSSTLLDHVRKLYFRMKRREPENRNALWVLSFLMWLVSEKRGTYAPDWKFNPNLNLEQDTISSMIPWDKQAEMWKRDPSNPILAEKFYRLSADYWYLPAQEMLAATYKDKNKIDESRRYTELSNAQSGYTTWAVNNFSYELSQGFTTKAFEHIRFARLDDEQRANELSLEHCILWDVRGRTVGLKYLMWHPQFLSCISSEARRKYIQHAKYLLEHLQDKDKDAWTLDDLILMLDILRFQYDSLTEEFWYLQGDELDRITAERAYNYWSQIVISYKIGWPPRSKKWIKKDIFSTHGRRAILYHLDNFFRRDNEDQREEENHDSPGIAKMNDIYGDRRDLWLSAMSFSEYSREVEDVLETTIGITWVEFLESVSSTSMAMLEVKDLIAIFLSRLGNSPIEIARGIWIEGLSWDELLNVLLAREEALRSSIH